MGKYHQNSFRKDKASQASQPLALIGSDVCGPTATYFIGAAKYLLTFIDDFSHFLWVYTIKSKDEVSRKFKNPNLLWKIKCLMTNGGA
jgi:hypothetical protein